jgi:monoamine oxidase
LNLDVFEQYIGEKAIYEASSMSPAQLVSLPPNDAPSYRIKGGTYALLQALIDLLDAGQFHTGVVKSIEKQDDGLLIKTNSGDFKSKVVVSTLPPFLFKNSITVQPSLPSELLELAETTHTWMGESIKISLVYKQPFWKKDNTSGTIFSNVGPIPEMYDHSNNEEGLYALKGFLNESYFSVKKEERLELILSQLQKYYGEQARDFVFYEELLWKKEAFTSLPYSTPVVPHQNNGDALYQKSYLDNCLFLAGTETASEFSGYMEGAVRSAKFVMNSLLT